MELEERPFQVAKIVNDTCNMFEPQAKEKNILYEVSNDLGQISLIGDETRIQQILINLIGNAFKFTSSGKITVRSFIEEQNNQKMLNLVIEDTGIGISPDKIENIFGKFVQADQSITRRYGGSGLGLAISRSFIELMGGDIALQSKVGKGSIFTVKLPFKK